MQNSMLYDIILESEGEIQTFSGKQELRELDGGRPALQETLMKCFREKENNIDQKLIST